MTPAWFLGFRAGKVTSSSKSPSGLRLALVIVGRARVLNIGKLSPGGGEYYVGEIATSAEDYYTGSG